MRADRKIASAAVNYLDLPEFASGPMRTAAEREAKTALQHLYFTQAKTAADAPLARSAVEYAAVKATAQDPPKLTRVYFGEESQRKLKLERDVVSLNGLRTRSAIPVGHVLQSHDSAIEVTRASEDFKHAFNNARQHRLRLNIDAILSSEDAAAMLRMTQTPSPQDEFPNLTGSWAVLDHRNA
jgi:hypothetical protein